MTQPASPSLTYSCGLPGGFNLAFLFLDEILTKEFNGRYSEKFVDLVLKMLAFNEDRRINFIYL